MESSSKNLFGWLFGPKQTADAQDPPKCVPQSSSDSTNVPSPHGLAVCVELKQRGSEALDPAEAKGSSPSEQEKVNSNAGPEDQLTEMVGRTESGNEYDREEDCADGVESASGSTCRFIHAAPINIKVPND